MNKFIEINPEEIAKDPYTLLKTDWTLITVRDGETANPMTASWGGFGVLWNMNVCYIFVRNTRHTFNLLKNETKLSLCFMPGNRRDVMNYCGANSGSDGSKIAALNLTYFDCEGYPCIEEAEMIMQCEKLYETDMLPDGFVSPDFEEKFYPKKDYHRMYVCSINKVLMTK